MPLHPPSHPSLTHVRTFTCTAQNLAKSTKQRLKYEHTAVPPYPYGPSQIYKQSNFGLYGTQKIRFGNMVSEKNEIKTRRYWRPNVQFKRLWSEALQNYIKLRITTRVLRTVDKVGGLDEYLLGEKAARIKELGMGGWKLRWRIMQTNAVKERFRLQREAYGLPPKVDAPTRWNGQKATKLQVAEEIREFDADIAKGQELEIGEDMEEQVVEPGSMQEEPMRSEKVVL
ncbi:uncharacterized protein LY89DRAFT_687418 [Mollisia scopiformis]|uniref:Large ribosomal subunit protein bL28m n=1 Tax=Mollisia scopiformis TaxID=149040 RepID=A0A194WZ31_MOLSC|nr:uncharacterized protein LY89DRAFT_687418 [Mollisia scopiformis]KUJ13215.1 hypothetical protein LY89DRAFT_687418 [Mollisia scopiformis]